MIEREQKPLPPCPMCDKGDAFMGKTVWGHDAYCCSDECGIAYRDSVKRREKELEIAKIRASGARMEVARAELRLEEARQRTKLGAGA